jgi:hypothetical protein
MVIALDEFITIEQSMKERAVFKNHSTVITTKSAEEVHKFTRP